MAQLAPKIGFRESVVMRAIVARFANDESGATSIEYALIAVIVSLGLIVGLGAIRDGLNNHFNNVSTELSK